VPSTDAAARLAIEHLVARYCDAVTRADATTFASCWTVDGHWLGPGLDRRGRDDITRAWEKMRGRVRFAVQAIQSHRVRIEGTRATGTCWVRELLVSHDGAPRETVGRYDDEYEYGVDGWQLARRAFTPVRAAT
jgi:uncharacterized protein (TIGR02246 family)